MSKKVIKAAVIAAVVCAGILTMAACQKDNENFVKSSHVQIGAWCIFGDQSYF